MTNKLLELIDFEKVNVLLEGFNKTTGFVTAILDLEGNVLSKSGWRQICTEFHRINAETSKKCTISDTQLANKLAEGEKYHFYKCLNGLVDVAVPIVVKGEHIGNLFTGQFFFEKPKRDFFIQQAKKYNFDTTKYIDALEKVPVVSEEKVKIAMDFLLNMTLLFSEMGAQNQEQVKLNTALTRSEEKFSSAFNKSPLPLSIIDFDTGIRIAVNEKFIETFGYSREELLSGNFQETNLAADKKELKKAVNLIINNGFLKDHPFQMLTKNGKTQDLLVSAARIGTKDKNQFIVSNVDITERKQAEHNITETHLFLAKAQEIGKIGTWKLNIQENKLFWTDENYKIFGVKVGTPLTYEIFINCIHPEDREFVNQEWTSKMMTNDYDIQHRLLVKNEVKWVREKAEITFNSKGEPVEAIGFTQDITDRKQAEDEIENHKKHLEQLVKERTAELESKNEDLQQMNKLFVGRELRMVELKEKIKELEEKLKN